MQPLEVIYLSACVISVVLTMALFFVDFYKVDWP